MSSVAWARLLVLRVYGSAEETSVSLPLNQKEMQVSRPSFSVSREGRESSSLLLRKMVNVARRGWLQPSSILVVSRSTTSRAVRQAVSFLLPPSLQRKLLAEIEFCRCRCTAPEKGMLLPKREVVDVAN